MAARGADLWVEDAKERRRRVGVEKRRATMAAKAAKAAGVETGPSLEHMFCEPTWFGVTLASPLQRAWCRIADGLPLGELASDPLVVASLAPCSVDTWRALLWGSAEARAAAAAGLDRSGIEALERAAAARRRPAHVIIVAGVRSGKTVFASASVVRGSACAELRHATEGDIPRVSLVSLTTDLSSVAFRYLTGASLAAPAVRALLRGQPGAGRLALEARPGLTVEVAVVPASQAGASLAARWSAGVVFDEAPRMGGSECAASYDDMRAVAEERLLPGAQVVSIGSPWAALGPLYELVRQHHGHPSLDLVVVRAPSPAANPTHWTRERVEALEASAASGGTSHLVRASVWAEFLEAADEVMFPASHIDACVRRGDPPSPSAHAPAVAAMDPATRRNAWTLVVAIRDPARGVLRVASARQWLPSASPLDAAETLRAIRDECARWGVDLVHTDQWSGDALTALGLALPGGRLVVSQQTLTERERWDAADALRLALEARRVELPADPQLLDDLRRARKALSRTGVSLDLPTTPDGRHCDYVPALVLAAAHAPPWAGAPIARSAEEDGPEGELGVEASPLEDVLDRWSLGLDG